MYIRTYWDVLINTDAVSCIEYEEGRMSAYDGLREIEVFELNILHLMSWEYDGRKGIKPDSKEDAIMMMADERLKQHLYLKILDCIATGRDFLHVPQFIVEKCVELSKNKNTQIREVTGQAILGRDIEQKWGSEATSMYKQVDKTVSVLANMICKFNPNFLSTQNSQKKRKGNKKK